MFEGIELSNLQCRWVRFVLKSKTATFAIALACCWFAFAWLLIADATGLYYLIGGSQGKRPEIAAALGLDVVLMLIIIKLMQRLRRSK
jgi:hypothetical protein